jgi:DNA-binding CsgD family transcriptional regulator/tetratricopeptide (TPR) repeat protein
MKTPLRSARAADPVDNLPPYVVEPHRGDPVFPLMSTSSPTTPTHPQPMLHGRQDVVDAIAGLAAGAAVGEGGALTVVGEAGIGKTAVVEEAAAIIAVDQPDCRILRLNGVEAEVELAWSGLSELLSGVLDGIDRLAPARASAVRAALAMEGVDQPVEPFAIALATRDLLVEAAEDAPIVIIVDDLQSVDLPTRRTLSYIARRLQFERLVIVSTRRAGADNHTDTGPVVNLDVVGADVADAILRDAGVTAANVRRELIAASGGIPLVLVEAANLLNAEQRSGRAELPDPLPIGASGQRAIDLLLERLSPRVLDALLVAAAEPDGDLVRIINALRLRSLGVQELESAEEHGVVVLDGDRLTFRHPLMRSAAYHDAPRADRRAAHRALASTLPKGSPARAWHLARAAVGPDEEVARELEEAALVTNQRGAPATAARSWELASRLSPDPADRVRRLRMAAVAILDAGMAAAAGRLLDRADAVVSEQPAADDLIERIRRQQLRCRLPPSGGGSTDPVQALRRAALEVAGAAPEVAVDLVFDALAAYIRDGAFADMASAIEESRALRDRVDEPRARRIDIMVGALHVARGQSDGEPLLDRYAELTGPTAVRQPADALFLAEVLAPSLGFLRRTSASEALLAELENDLRARGAVRPLISVLAAQAVVQYGRSFPSTMAAGMEAIALAEANETPELASLAAGVLSLCAAAIGDTKACEHAAALLRDVPEPERRAMAEMSLGYLALNQGRLEDALVIYEQIVRMSPIGRGLVRWEPEYMETLIRLGQRERAAGILAEIEQILTPDQLWPHGIGRPKGMLAEDDDEASEYFNTTVVAAERIGNLVGAGRTEILWGERLRRARRRAEARTHLERAVEILRGVGATVLAERATTELRAAGGVVGEDMASHQLLTPHELQVARLVVGGASNRDLAAKLFISPRTVEAHLTAIFRKLGVRNRRELAARAIDDPILQP